jgi:nitrogen fixation protein NifU and related proteins
MELFKNGKLQEHYRNPRNAGCMENADGKGRSVNPVSGDVIEIFLKIEAGWIIHAKFKSFGSPAAIAVSSLITELVKGRKIEDAVMLSSQVLGELVGDLSTADLHCLVLAKDAFMNALDDYGSRSRVRRKAATG